MTVTFRIGRRSIFLLMMGTVFLIYGVNLADTVPATLQGTLGYLPEVIEPFIPLPWLASGSTALVTAIAAPRYEWLGFTALYVVAGLWASTFVVACFLDGWPGAIAGAVVWGLVLGVILLIAGWPDPDPGRVNVHGHSHGTGNAVLENRTGETGADDEGHT